jgi:hypothetical protein
MSTLKPDVLTNKEFEKITAPVKQSNMNTDYWFLRDNGVQAITAICIVGLAYKEDAVIIGYSRMRKCLKNEIIYARRHEKNEKKI